MRTASTIPSAGTAVACACCGSPDVNTFFRQDNLPIHCHLLCTTHEQASQVPRGTVELGFCRQCGLIGNLAFDPGLMAYCPRYENALDFSPRFQSYADKLAQRLVERFDLHGKAIIEIACGRGEFLKRLCVLGDNRGIGFDPACPDETVSPLDKGRVRFVRDYYSPKYAEVAADLICCRHALEHIHRPVEFLRMVRDNIGNRMTSRVFFEVPNALFTLREMGIWDIIYEHCLYFVPESLGACFRLAGFEVLDVSEQYEGQFLSIEAAPRDDRVTADESKPTTVPSELTGWVEGFGGAYRAKVAQWRARLAAERDAGRRVVLWGSGSKGVTFLNSLPESSLIESVVDINPHKQGMYVAGAGQRIISPQALAESPPDLVIVMNPIYVDEITGMMRAAGQQPEVAVA